MVEQNGYTGKGYEVQGVLRFVGLEEYCAIENLQSIQVRDAGSLALLISIAFSPAHAALICAKR
jgi:hypothetical protein